MSVRQPLQRLERTFARALPLAAVLIVGAVPLATPRAAEAQYRTTSSTRAFRWTSRSLADAILAAEFQRNDEVVVDGARAGSPHLLVHNLTMNVMYWEDKSGRPTTRVPASRGAVAKVLTANRVREDGSRDARFDPASLPRTIAMMLEPTRVLHAHSATVSAMTTSMLLGAEFDAVAYETLLSRHGAEQRRVIEEAVTLVRQRSLGTTFGSYDAEAGRRRARGRAPSDVTNDGVVLEGERTSSPSGRATQAVSRTAREVGSDAAWQVKHEIKRRASRAVGKIIRPR